MTHQHGVMLIGKIDTSASARSVVTDKLKTGNFDGKLSFSRSRRR